MNNNQTDIKTDRKNDRAKDKMSYNSPQLVTYGDIRELTNATITNVGAFDSKVDPNPGDDVFFKTG